MIVLHEAKCIINENCLVLKKEVLNELKKDDVVRISIYFDEDPINDTWDHDAPFIKVLQIDGDDVLGEVLEKNKRLEYNHKYPVPIGEKIWFRKINIIEIHENIKKEMLSGERVLISGPLYTTFYLEDTSSEGSESSHSTGDTYLS